jgi:hypothetical protein
MDVRSQKQPDKKESRKGRVSRGYLGISGSRLPVFARIWGLPLATSLSGILGMVLY